MASTETTQEFLICDIYRLITEATSFASLVQGCIPFLCHLAYNFDHLPPTHLNYTRNMAADAMYARVPHDITRDQDDGNSPYTASTILYSEHEPWETYKDKVFRLCRLLWPDSPIESIYVGRLRGGASNRVVSISVPGKEGFFELNTSVTDIGKKPDLASASSKRYAPQDTESQDHDESKQQVSIKEYEDGEAKAEKLNVASGNYILRIPRWKSCSGEHEMAILRFVRSRVAVGIPTVAHFDVSSGDNNPLDSPYVLQHRIPGRRLDSVWRILSHTQRLLITIDIARLFQQLMKVTNNSGGFPDFECGPTTDGMLRTTDPCFPGDDKEARRILSPKPPVDMLCERLARWGAKYPKNDGSSPYFGAIEMVQQMQRTNNTFGAEGSEQLYYLSHGDFFPRNIMVELSGQRLAYITGVLDWDDAQFAPAIVSFAPPAWLWIPGFWKKVGEEGYVDEDDVEKLAGAEPGDVASKEIKALFDMAVGPRFLQYAYSGDAQVARSIWSSAYVPEGMAWIEDEVESLYERWKIDQGRAAGID